MLLLLLLTLLSAAASAETPEEHVEHLRLVLGLLRKHRLYAKLSKCEFNQPELKFLGHVVGRAGIKVDPAKVEVVMRWPQPRSLKELQGFLGLANYFRKFMEHYSQMVACLTDLTGKAGQTFDWDHWGDAQLAAFAAVKHALSTAPVLALPDPSLTFELMTDASLAGTGGVLMQVGRVIAYTSVKFSDAEIRYTTGEQELLGLVRATREWRCYLEGAPEVVLLTDHQPLTYLGTQPLLSRRYARWVAILSRINYRIEYWKGSDNVADPLSRCPVREQVDEPEADLAVVAIGFVSEVILALHAKLVVSRGGLPTRAADWSTPVGAPSGGGEPSLFVMHSTVGLTAERRQTRAQTRGITQLPPVQMPKKKPRASAPWLEAEVDPTPPSSSP